MNVADMGELATEYSEVFFQSAEFWVGFTFVIVVIGIFSPIKKVLKDLLSKRIEKIKSDLQEAEELKYEAQRLYAEYERKLLNKDEEVAEIVKEENDVIMELKEKKEHDLDVFLNQKKLEIQSKIDQSIETVNNEIKEQISTKVADILLNTFKTKLTQKDYDILIENSIENIRKTVG